ncbi:MAG: GNAT family N-acetyltransferase [Alphaproteobacteria bacterium]|nr:GNAT family N-acetyltransferase [Alphaproteobacteria bacterium]MDD9920013.1 GNAT family N-acetyltransferase [Alphaproteobacteria bacterium]
MSLLNWQQDDAVLTVQVAGDVADIVDITVPESLRRQGVATHLLQQAMAELVQQSVKELFLEVRTSNTPAIGLYQKLGAIHVGHRPTYYTNPTEDADVYKITL